MTAVWTFLILAAVADVVTTLYGFHLGLTEWNPVANRALLEYGLAGKLALKAGVVGYTVLGFLVVRELGSRSGAVATVGIVALTWFIATGWNLLVILASVA